MTIPTEYYRFIRKNPNLVAYWRLNDLTGTKAIDWSGKFNLNGIYNGSPTSDVPLIQNDTIAGSKLFGSEGQNMEVPNATPLRIIGDITLEAWFIPLEASENGTIISKANETGSVAAPYSLEFSSSKKANFRVGNGTSFISTESKVLELKKVYHVCCTKNRKEIYIYINGIKENSRGAIPEIKDLEKSFYIGSSGKLILRKFNGLIGEVAIYSAALGISEIKNHFNIGRQIIFRKPYYTTYDKPSYS